MRLVLQRGDGDCGVAALATLLEQSYEDAYLAVSSVEASRRGKSGLTDVQLMKAARVFRVELVRRQPVDLDTDEGILVVRWPRLMAKALGYPSHYVVLGHGVIVDPADGFILPADEYLKRMNAKAGRLLEVA